jgi:CHAT domain-containing protein
MKHRPHLIAWATLITVGAAAGAPAVARGQSANRGQIVQSVVATHWRIGDRSPAGFVGDFYRALAGGAPMGDALRAAKLDAIRRGAKPREWAGFIAMRRRTAR